MSAYGMETLLGLGLLALAGLCIAWAVVRIIRGTL